VQEEGSRQAVGGQRSIDLRQGQAAQGQALVESKRSLVHACSRAGGGGTANLVTGMSVSRLIVDMLLSCRFSFIPLGALLLNALIFGLLDALVLGEDCVSTLELGSFFLVVLGALLLKAVSFSINLALALSKDCFSILLLGSFPSVVVGALLLSLVSIHDTLIISEVCVDLLNSFASSVISADLLEVLNFGINIALALSKGRFRLLLLGCFFLDNCGPASDFLLGIEHLSLLS